MSSLSSEAHIFNPSSSFVLPFFLFFSYLPSPFFNVKTYAAEEKEKADFCCSTLQPLILSASFSLFETRGAWSHQSPSLCVFSLAFWLIAIVKKTPSKAALSPPFVFLGDRVMSDGVTFFRCALQIGSGSTVVPPSPVAAVYVPQRQTQSLPSREKLSTLVLIWLLGFCFRLTLKNCSR